MGGPINGFKVTEWVVGFAADGSTIAGALWVAWEAIFPKRYATDVDNVQRGLGVLVTDPAAPDATAGKYLPLLKSTAEALVRIQAARTGLKLIVFGFILQLAARIFDVLAEVSN